MLQAFSPDSKFTIPQRLSETLLPLGACESHTIDAITLFGDKNTKNVVLEKSYKEYLEGFKDITGGSPQGLYRCGNGDELRFPEVESIVTEQDKKDFVKLFGEYLRIENILQNYDEFTHLKVLNSIDVNDAEAMEEFKSTYHVSDEDIKAMEAWWF